MDNIIMHGNMEYTKGYKYQLHKNLMVEIPDLIKFGEIQCDFIHLESGFLRLLKGYAWDGASGPTIVSLQKFV